MRTVSRLRLLFFLLFTSLLMCCPLCYLLPCRNYSPPSEAHPLEPIKWFLSSNTCTSGGGGGICIPVQNTFYFTSYSNITPVFINKLIQFWQIFFLVFHKYLWHFFFGCNCYHNLIDWFICNLSKHLSVC